MEPVFVINLYPETAVWQHGGLADSAPSMVPMWVMENECACCFKHGIINMKTTGDWRGSAVGKALYFYPADPSLISGVTYGPPGSARRARSDS